MSKVEFTPQITPQLVADYMINELPSDVEIDTDIGLPRSFFGSHTMGVCVDCRRILFNYELHLDGSCDRCALANVNEFVNASLMVVDLQCTQKPSPEGQQSSEQTRVGTSVTNVSLVQHDKGKDKQRKRTCCG